MTLPVVMAMRECVNKLEQAHPLADRSIAASVGKPP